MLCEAEWEVRWQTAVRQTVRQRSDRQSDRQYPEVLKGAFPSSRGKMHFLTN